MQLLTLNGARYQPLNSEQGLHYQQDCNYPFDYALQ